MVVDRIVSDFALWHSRISAVAAGLGLVFPAWLPWLVTYQRAMYHCKTVVKRTYTLFTSYGSDDMFMRRLKELPPPNSADYVIASECESTPCACLLMCSCAHQALPSSIDIAALSKLRVRPHASVSQSHRCWKPSTSKYNMKRVSRELRFMREGLPVDPGSSTFLLYDKTRPYVQRALITGPPGTPYDSGCFTFDMACPPEYPSKPPEVLITSTDGGRVRFSPNLYAAGKVCLSLLGTWLGVGSETWNKDCTLMQVRGVGLCTCRM